MRLLNFIIAITIAVVLPPSILADDMFCENLVWNYLTENIEYGIIESTTEDYGYHFNSTREADGKTYSVYLNGNDEEVALMRQEGGKVYLYLNESLKMHLEWQKESIENFDEIFGTNPTEMLLYDFEAQIGGSYYMPLFLPDLEDFFLTPVFVVGLKDVCINGETLTSQTISAYEPSGVQNNIVKGIGPDVGMFHRPQLINFIPGFSYSFTYIKDVKTSDGSVLFDREDFKHNVQTSYVVNDSYIWEYEGKISDGYFTYCMRFDGVTYADGKFYHILSTYEGKDTWYENPENGFVNSDIKNGLKFLMREEDGKVYLHAPIGSKEDGYSQWPIDDHEALLYDFNVQEGDNMTVIGSCGNLLNGTVTSVISAIVEGKNYSGYTIKFDQPNLEFTVMQGMGNVSNGCLPYFIEDEMAEYISKVTYVPMDLAWQNLHRVVDAYSSDIICEKDADGLWPWEKSDSVTELETYSKVFFDGKTITADCEAINVYAPSGNIVASGFGEISTESLMPGVYVAIVGSWTLKILVP